MYPATLALLEALTAHVHDVLSDRYRDETHPDAKPGYLREITELDDALDRARHELKGGA
ncbi:hypothetical protein ES703_19880 [subsurface metagenome]